MQVGGATSEGARPKNWVGTEVPFRWLECMPAEAWKALLATCRCSAVIDLSLPALLRNRSHHSRKFLFT